MKLYELPRNSYFTIEDDPQQYVYLFKHVDGMYSVCYYDDKLIHIAAWTDVQLVRPHTQSPDLTPKFA
jgi:hypothetical protein